MLRLLFVFVLAVLLTSAFASIFQTQSNLAALQALGVPVSFDVRLGTTCLDLLGFTPTFVLLTGAGFAVALPFSLWLAQRLPPLRWGIFVVAGAVAIWLALAVANSLAPVPTLIAADRDPLGTLVFMVCGSAGALLFGLLCRRGRCRSLPTTAETP